MSAPRNPFKGAVPYHGDAPVAPSRSDRTNEELLIRILANRLVWVYGPAQSGKTSLLSSSLLPRMQKEYQYRLAEISFARLTNGPAGAANDLLDALGRAFDTQPLLATDLSERTDELIERIEKRSSSAIVLFFDQLELLLDRRTFAVAEVERISSVLSALVSRPLHWVPQRFIVFCLREESLGPLRERFGHHPLPISAEYRIERLTVAEMAQSAVRLAGSGQPAQQWETARLERFLMQLRGLGQPAEPSAELDAPLAQLALQSLWNLFHRQGCFPEDEAALDAPALAREALQHDLKRNGALEDGQDPAQGNLLGPELRRQGEQILAAQDALDRQLKAELDLLRKQVSAVETQIHAAQQSMTAAEQQNRNSLAQHSTALTDLLIKQQEKSAALSGLLAHRLMSVEARGKEVQANLEASLLRDQERLRIEQDTRAKLTEQQSTIQSLSDRVTQSYDDSLATLAKINEDNSKQTFALKDHGKEIAKFKLENDATIKQIYERLEQQKIDFAIRFRRLTLTAFLILLSILIVISLNWWLNRQFRAISARLLAQPLAVSRPEPTPPGQQTKEQAPTTPPPAQTLQVPSTKPLDGAVADAPSAQSAKPMRPRPVPGVKPPPFNQNEFNAQVYRLKQRVALLNSQLIDPPDMDLRCEQEECKENLKRIKQLCDSIQKRSIFIKPGSNKEVEKLLNALDEKHHLRIKCFRK